MSTTVDKPGTILNSEQSLNHHYDTLKPDFVIDVKDLKNEELSQCLIFANGRTVVITQLTSEKATYMIANWDSLFGSRKIVNLYLDPYNSLYGFDASLMGLALELGKCCKTTPDIKNVYFIIREGTYCRIN